MVRLIVDYLCEGQSFDFDYNLCTDYFVMLFVLRFYRSQHSVFFLLCLKEMAVRIVKNKLLSNACRPVSSCLSCYNDFSLL